MFEKIFNSFSYRNEKSEEISIIFPNTVRKRIIMLWEEIFVSIQDEYNWRNFWKLIYRKIKYKEGKFKLVENQPTSVFEQPTEADDLYSYINICSNESFLDVIEYIFQEYNTSGHQYGLFINEAVGLINELLDTGETNVFLTD